MITELSIEGFKSFGSPAETIELGPLNFFVGANASGKSNLLSALEFLQNAVAHDVSYAVSETGRKCRGQKQTPPSATASKAGSVISEAREGIPVLISKRIGTRG